ncbi:hypothetical protein G7Z17_g12412 [Cylindrodendrum hubeiense]|uniref:HECT-type E3 ubiquitin transferase n=1 Tax=Cylindrodendrum hubeiense TaxID=595255 RepID=A0A9P5LAN1_9HYPO|nr:hypothetical protein G7Z17_g12412 [Cylindrodendrum hubeiense]
MTPETTRAPGGPLDTSSDLDLLAGLWQEAPFARLPPDAPTELDAYVQDIENPSRVYAIHRASRRNDFQLLVERTLAVYLASQDNPEDGLCPNLRKQKDLPAAPNNLIFSARSPSPSRPEFKKATFKSSPTRRRDSADDQRQRHTSQQKSGQKIPDSLGTANPGDSGHDSQQSLQLHDSPSVSYTRVVEGPTSKDHRSFAANLFGTVAFKMLEWLTPRGIEAMSQQMSEIHTNVQSGMTLHSDLDQKPLTNSSQTQPSLESRTQHPGSQASAREADAKVKRAQGHTEGPTDENPQTETSNASKTKSRRCSLPKTKTPSTSKPRRATSLEPFLPTAGSDDTKSTILSPRFNGFHEKPARPKPTTTVTGRGIPEMPSKPVFFENVLPPNPQHVQKLKLVPVLSEDPCEKDFPEKPTVTQPRQVTTGPHPREEPEKPKAEIPASWLHNALPQALSRLDVDTVDFMCNVLQEDGTWEDQLVVPGELDGSCPKPLNPSKPLARRTLNVTKSSKKEWKEFTQQTIFNVLGNPQATIESFTRDGKPFDSQTLWYCLHRLSRVAPSLVFHSLWVAAGSLFVPPPGLQTSKSANAKSRGTNMSQTRLSDAEAGQFMSICMHALVAAAPIVPDSRTLYEMSRIRSNGLTLAGGISVARQPASRCLDYDDAFSNEVAIRLARRLFCAITARRCFTEMAGRGASAKGRDSGIDVLRPLVHQLDFLSSGSAPVLEFEHSERLLHETRVPTVLLDWARTILLSEWDGRPDFSMDGPFGGALSFIETMYENRNLLLLGDIQFRVDYLSDRLDSIEMPVDWLTFTSTRWRRHILDYPYIFSPETLVSFFRSINFARMSRMFEESSSLKTRMSAIVDPGSLITNPHHKMVLQDLLQTASSKYLILEISRDHVVRDAFDQLWRREERELLRPMKVHLGEEGGEEGFDSGGVQQEFFRLAIAECLDPRYGAFTVDERTRMVWFAPGSLTEEWKFELVGLLMSLALYNGLTLPITFPKALYRKLLGKPVEELHHVADGWPELASGLTTLLEWDEQDGLVEDVFARTYEFSVAGLGTNITREMSSDISVWPKAAATLDDVAPPDTANPSDAPMVTNDNRDAYVNDYVRYLTDVSVRPQYLAFERGFRACLDKKSLSLLSPPTLQALVEGVQDIDISELRRYTRYVGWDASHHTVRDFWSIVKRYDDRMKRRLLEFVTSSDRVPVGGMKNLQFVIQKNGEEEGDAGHLPTAYTCYGTLLLPEYRDKEVLRERVGMALENAQGFGFA